MENYKKFLELAEKIKGEEISTTVKGKRTKASAKRIRLMPNEARKIIVEAKRDLLPRNTDAKPLFVEEKVPQKTLSPEYDVQYVLGGVA